MGAAKTMEAGNRIQPERGPSRGRGGHAGVEDQTGETRNATTTHFISEGVAPSKGLTMSLNKKGKFDNELPNGETGEQGVQPGVQAPVDVMENVGQGNELEEINLASLSLGSATEKLSYLFLMAEVRRLYRGAK
jgi:hypothetical protein